MYLFPKPLPPTPLTYFPKKILGLAANFTPVGVVFIATTCLALIRVLLASRALMQMSETTRSGFWGVGMPWLSNWGVAGGRTGSGSGALRFFGGWGPGTGVGTSVRLSMYTAHDTGYFIRLTLNFFDIHVLSIWAILHSPNQNYNKTNLNYGNFEILICNIHGFKISISDIGISKFWYDILSAKNLIYGLPKFQ